MSARVPCLSWRRVARLGVGVAPLGVGVLLLIPAVPGVPPRAPSGPTPWDGGPNRSRKAGPAAIAPMHRHGGVEHGANDCRLRQRGHEAGGKGGASGESCGSGQPSREPRRPVVHRAE
jgi:hypothetical protein